MNFARIIEFLSEDYLQVRCRKSRTIVGTFARDNQQNRTPTQDSQIIEVRCRKSRTIVGTFARDNQQNRTLTQDSQIIEAKVATNGIFKSKGNT